MVDDYINGSTQGLAGVPGQTSLAARGFEPPGEAAKADLEERRLKAARARGRTNDGSSLQVEAGSECISWDRRETDDALQFDPYPPKSQHEGPFSVGRVQFSLPGPLTILLCNSNILLLLLTPPSLSPTSLPSLIRIDLSDPSVVDSIELPLPPLLPAVSSTSAPSRSTSPAPPARIYGVYCDPTGRHALVSLSSGDNYHISLSSAALSQHAAAATAASRRAGANASRTLPPLGPAVRPLPKLKGSVVSCVGWHPSVYAAPSASSSTTKEVLLGLVTGSVLAAVFVDTISGSAGGDSGPFSFGRGGGGAADKLVRPVWSAPEGEAITGVAWDVWTPTAGKAGGSGKRGTRRAAAVVTTATRLYQFVDRVPGGKSVRDDDEADGAILEKLFAAYSNLSQTPRSLEIPASSPHSSLHLFRPSPPSHAHPPSLAWHTGTGVFHGTLSLASQEPGDNIISGGALVPFPPRIPPPSPSAPGLTPLSPLRDRRDNGEGETSEEDQPVGLALTEWHFVLLYKDRVKAIRRLDDRIVYEEMLDLKPSEHVLGITADPVSRTYWVHSDRSIFELVVRDEGRDVWRVFLSRQAFPTALEHARNNADKDVIRSAQADHLFSIGKYIPAAQLYARCSKSFEEVVLGFIDQGERDALRLYLLSRLERLPSADLTQRMMLATWLTEIYLAKINELEDLAASEVSQDDAANMLAEQGHVEDEMRQLLSAYRGNLDPRTTYDLIASHGRTDMMLFLARLLADYDRIVRHHIQEDEWSKAIDALSGQDDLGLYYRHASVLVRHAPLEATTSFRRQPALDVRRLLPALIQPRVGGDAKGKAKATDVGIESVTDYILFAIAELDCTDTQVHNAIVTLYATRFGSDEAPLLRFLASTPDDPMTGKPYYDLDHALRLCKAHGRLQSCGLIYGKMGLYESSVELALETGDVELAKMNADRPVDDPLLRKKLWLKVAKYVVGEQGDLKAAMRFLESTDILNIEDVLPFFPDFVVIDDFKEEIVAALEAYSAKIDRLKDEMDESTRSAEAIKADIADLAERFVVLDPNDACASCGFHLLTRPFYVFPCQHAFHADCLIKEVTQHMPQHQLRRLLALQTKLAQAAAQQQQQRTSEESRLLADGKRLALAGVQGLDQVRKLIVPDALVSAIGGGVGAVGAAVLPGRSRGDALEGAATADAEAAAVIIAQTSGQPSTGQAGLLRPAPKEDKKVTDVDRWKGELDDLLASKCVLCDLALNSLDRPFVEEGEEI